MAKQKTQPSMENDSTGKNKVVLTLTLTGQREHLTNLLEQMDEVGGFSVISGSFTQYSVNQSSNQQ